MYTVPVIGYVPNISRYDTGHLLTFVVGIRKIPEIYLPIVLLGGMLACPF